MQVGIFCIVCEIKSFEASVSAAVTLKKKKKKPAIVLLSLNLKQKP